ncbi:unnamed protein product [Cylicocyclus nassatus]|uniref:TGF-beta family profile domain-containing protein n=1 Tax=Cylicocyclus nassatus TaxID=53992 RepID=A0AA36DN11_CYLNA|nr:unnamed protein product [Cylicocyclus nassatus]
MAAILILSSLALVSGKGLMLLEESRGQTLAYPLENVPTAPIENHVLDILELEEPPPLVSLLKRNEKVTNFMAQLYHDLEKSNDGIRPSAEPSGEDWSSADRIVSFSPTETKHVEGLFVSKYNREDLPSSTSQLVAAQLRIFLPEETTFAKVSIYSKNSGNLELIGSTIATSREKTVSFNVSQIVSKWMNDVFEPQIYIRLDGGIDSMRSANSKLESFILAVFVDGGYNIPPPRTRSKRSVETVSGEDSASLKEAEATKIVHSEVEGCHVQSLYLNFADIGWREWVIAPEGYSANYCVGACSSDSPMHSKMNATNHAIVQTLVHLVDPKRADEAKCAPVQLSPAKILFIDNHGNVVMRRYQDMTVQECGCL